MGKTEFRSYFLAAVAFGARPFLDFGTSGSSSSTSSSSTCTVSSTISISSTGGGGAEGTADFFPFFDAAAFLPFAVVEGTSGAVKKTQDPYLRWIALPKWFQLGPQSKATDKYAHRIIVRFPAGDVPIAVATDGRIVNIELALLFQIRCEMESRLGELEGNPRGSEIGRDHEADGLACSRVGTPFSPSCTQRPSRPPKEASRALINKELRGCHSSLSPQSWSGESDHVGCLRSRALSSEASLATGQSAPVA